MTTPHSTALDRARSAWLAGDADAWGHYLACLRDLKAAARGPKHPRPERRPRRPRARA